MRLSFFLALGTWFAYRSVANRSFLFIIAYLSSNICNAAKRNFLRKVRFLKGCWYDERPLKDGRKQRGGIKSFARRPSKCLKPAFSGKGLRQKLSLTETFCIAKRFLGSRPYFQDARLLGGTRHQQSLDALKVKEFI